MHAAVTRECRTVRDAVGLFDASTLGKIEVVGPDAAEFLNRIYVNACSEARARALRYGIMLSEAGFVSTTASSGGSPRTASTSPRPPAARRGAPPHGGLSPDRMARPAGLADLDHRAMGGDRRPGAAIAREAIAPLVEGIDISPEAMPHMSVREGRIAGVPDAALPGELHRRARLRGQRASRPWSRRVGGGSRGDRRLRRHRLRHGGDACAARREGLHHRRPGDRRHPDARRCRPRLGGRQEQGRFRRQARARSGPTSRTRTASSSSAC